MTIASIHDLPHGSVNSDAHHYKTLKHDAQLDSSGDHARIQHRSTLLPS